MGTQEKPPPFLETTTATYTNLSDEREGERLPKLHHSQVTKTFAPVRHGGLRPCEVPDDAASAHQSTFCGPPHRERVPTALREYEAFFKVTLSDGATVNLLAPNETTWEGDSAAQEAVKFIEDPAAELEAFLLAFARSHWCVAVDVLP